MIVGEVPPAFGLDGAVKDSGLIIVTTQEAGTGPVPMAAILTQVRGCSPL